MRWKLSAARTVSAGFSSARSKCATWPSAWTPVSVRPAPCTVTRSPLKASTASSMRGLDRRAVVLALPADERRAVIFDRELVARHGSAGQVGSGTTAGGASTVPAAQGKAAQEGIGRLRRLARRAAASGASGRRCRRPRPESRRARRSPCPARRRPARAPPPAP